MEEVFIPVAEVKIEDEMLGRNEGLTDPLLTPNTEVRFKNVKQENHETFVNGSLKPEEVEVEEEFFLDVPEQCIPERNQNDSNSNSAVNVKMTSVENEQSTGEVDSSKFYATGSCLSKTLRRELDLSDTDISDDEEVEEENLDFGSEYGADSVDLEEMQELIEDSEQNVTKAASTKPRKRREIPLWRLVTDVNSAREIPQWLGELKISGNIRRPVEYFKDFFSSDILDHLVEQTNLYASQQSPDKPLKLDVYEFEQFIGTLFAMSMVKISNSRLYWSSNFQCPMVTAAFSRDRWEQIKSNLHCNDNSQMPIYGDHNYDKLYKIRPLISHLQGKFRKIPMPQMLCVDEQIVPFKDASSLKNYIPSKPHKSGFKIFALCDTTGILYDFEINDGPIEVVKREPNLDARSNIVLQLAQCIPVGMNHLIYHGNWFTSFSLVTTLAKTQIYSLGTVRQGRLPAIPFPSDKEFIKKGRGSYIEASALVDNVEVRAVKWADNKCVNLLSTFSSAHPMGECKRFDKTKKQITMIPCPAIVKTYNKFMGGVDQMDSLVALYRIHIRSKKYYHKLIFHFLDISVINSWLLYKRDCKNIGLGEKKGMNLQEFKMLVAKALLLHDKDGKITKRGHPSSSSIDLLQADKKARGHATKTIPGSEIRTDGYNHMPKVAEKGGRCRNPLCKGITVFYCDKCQVNLCLIKSRNCYQEFHQK